MKLHIYKNFQNKFHWELIATGGNVIDQSTYPATREYKAENDARHILAAHGIYCPEIVKETAPRNAKHFIL